jgi:hypothetical protein
MPAISPYAHRFRAVGGPAGAPAALLSGELAWNMQDKIWYAGFGDDGGGNATSLVAAFSTDGSLAKEVKTGGNALQVYRKNAANTGYEWATIAAGVTYTANNGVVIDGANNITVDASIARLDSPAFVNLPTAPTQAAGDNSTKLATTAYVTAKINAVIGGAAVAFDTFAELQALMQADDTETAAIIASLNGKMTASANLSDVSNLVTARANLGLGTMATQSAAAVAITGGTITGVSLRGGTF